jgi:CDP-diacylglycerol---glycerol-3-phosphate 3-phosphatidyltransferase
VNFWERFKKLNLPNKLTLGRIAAAPVLVVCLLSETVWGQYLALLVFIAAALTDYWDGRLARERNLVTNFGKIMDPLADKLLMATVFISFVELGYAPAWMVILIIGREFAITGMRVLAAMEGRDISASTSGKHKTISQIVAVLIILVVNVIVSSLRAWAPPWEYALMSLGVTGQILLYLAYYLPYAGMFVAAVLSLYSGLDYLLKNRELFRDPPA